jgi:ABC-type Mn2+/Zn2+ transport system permease subunit
VIDVLTEPFAYAFFGRAMIAGILIGAMCGALSVFVVLRRMSYIGHGLAHAVLGGVAVGLAFGADVYVGSVVATVVAALLIDRVTRRRGLHADAAIGIVTTAIFAIGVATLSIAPARVNVEAVLFGNILGVARTDLVVAGVVAIAFATMLVVLYKPLVLATFDPEIAAIHGVRTGAIELAFSLATAVVIVASVRVLGVLLIAAAVVIPAAVARLVTRSIGGMLAVATSVGVAASVVGLYGSYHVNVPSGPTIVLAGAAMFLAAFIATAFTARRGVALARRRVTPAPVPASAAPDADRIVPVPLARAGGSRAR